MPRDGAKVDTIVVTATRLPVSIGQLAQQIHVYDRARIEASGQATVTDFLSTLPEVSLNSPQSDGFVTTVRLRGAELGSALVLINGRRTPSITGASAFWGFFDLNTLPLAMVERIEVLPTGTSAIYGGDALAGIVNIVLRSDFRGLTVDAGYRWAKDTSELQASAGAGWSRGDFRASIIATYRYRTPMFGSERAITADSDLRRFGGPNLDSQFFGTPADVFSVAGNLPGLDSSFAAVPEGSSGIGLTPEEFRNTAGALNVGSFNRYQALVPRLREYGIFSSAGYRFSNELELFAELLLTKYTLYDVTTPPFLLLANVPASNAFNPFGTTVQVAGVVRGAESLAKVPFTDRLIRPLLGARGKAGAWHWEATAQQTRDKGSQIIEGQPDPIKLQMALASSNPNTALNPFVDGPMGSPSLLRSIYSAVVPTFWKAKTSLVNVFARGPILDLQSGQLDAVFGGEYERNKLERGFEASRSVKAAFGELRAPLGAPSGQQDILSLQLAARYDDYSDFGSKMTWQAGVEFRPAESLVLRSTYGTAFKPPTLYQLHVPDMNSSLPVSDPQRNGEIVVVQTVTGGNANLRPTSGRSTTFGLDWSPRHYGFNLSATYWRLRIENSVMLPNAQDIVNNSSIFPGRVQRLPGTAGEPGKIAIVDFSYINFGTMREAGVDLSLDWPFSTSLGELKPALTATYMTEFLGAGTPGAPLVDRLSRANNDGVFAPRLKGTVSIAWTSSGPFRLWMAGRYIGRYTDFTPPHKLGNFWYLDASLEVDLKRVLGLSRAPLKGLKLVLSGTNLANKLPTYSSYFRGYDDFNYDLVGRTVFARLETQL